MADRPGISFEKVVADIQAQVDPNAEVFHDEILNDRLGQKRQFDVVIRGRFAGQDILGVVECKDLKKKVGTPEIDGFVTKAQDINANFKIVVSRNGFTKPAIYKAEHYGIQTLSLIPNEEASVGFKIGNYWFADMYFWEQIMLRLHFVEEPIEKLQFEANQVKIHGKRIIDWYNNYLADNHDADMNLGWSAGVEATFDEPVMVEIGPNRSMTCKGVEFHAKRCLKKKRKFVGINGVGFFNWQSSQATLPPQKNIKTDQVQTNFMEWEDRESDEFKKNGFIHLHLVVCMAVDKVEDVIDLDAL